MRLKINFRSKPAENYFTVSGHSYKFDGSKEKELVSFQQAIESIKRLHQISDDYDVNLVPKSSISAIFERFEPAIKDNPETGIDLLKTYKRSIASEEILDLSFSFPFFPESLEKAIIDPSVSYGIPGELVIVIAKKEFKLNAGMPAEGKYKRSLYLIQRTMDDYQNKGLEMLIRESRYKAAVLYQMIEDCQYLKPIAEKSHRSETMIMAKGEHSFFRKVEALGYYVDVKTQADGSVMLIANYPTHSKELIEMFADRVLAL